MGTTRKQLEEAGRNVARAARALTPTDSSFCVLMWGPDESGQQWSTYVHNVAPIVGPDGLPDRRRHLANELRKMADTIESGADVPPGTVGRG